LALLALVAALVASEAVARRTRWRWHARTMQATTALVLALAVGRVLTSLVG
jgi:hypothetical protein